MNMYWLFVLTLLAGLAGGTEGAKICSRPEKIDGTRLFKELHNARMVEGKKTENVVVTGTKWSGFPSTIGDPNGDPEDRSKFDDLLDSAIKTACREMVPQETGKIEKCSTYVPNHEVVALAASNYHLTWALVFFVTLSILLLVATLVLKFPKNKMSAMISGGTYFIFWNIMRLFNCLFCCASACYRCLRPPSQSSVQKNSSDSDSSEYAIQMEEEEEEAKKATKKNKNNSKLIKSAEDQYNLKSKNETDDADDNDNDDDDNNTDNDDDYDSKKKDLYRQLNELFKKKKKKNDSSISE
jgi:hypothetical protein